jgi:hypothetical protein
VVELVHAEFPFDAAQIAARPGAMSRIDAMFAKGIVPKGRSGSEIGDNIVPVAARRTCP